MKDSLLVKSFRVLGWLEGASFLLLLLVGMPLKYLAGNPVAVKALGMPHGILFIAYVLMANFVAEELNWPMRTRLLAFAASVFPLGTFVFDKKYLSRSF